MLYIPPEIICYIFQFCDYQSKHSIIFLDRFYRELFQKEYNKMKGGILTRLGVIQHFNNIRIKNKWKKGWLMHKIDAKFDMRLSITELKYIADLLEYNPKWAYIQAKRYDW